MSNTISSVGHGLSSWTSNGGWLSNLWHGIFGKPADQPQADPLGLFGEGTGIGRQLPGQINQFANMLPGMQNMLTPGIQTAIQEAMPGTQQSQNLFDMLSRQYMNEVTPRLSGAGILTSGPGMNTISEGMGDLGTKFAQMQENQLNQALGTGLDYSRVFGALNAMPIEMRERLLSSIMGQPIYGGNTAQPGFWAQFLGPLGGGSGAANLGNSMGSAGGASSWLGAMA